MTSKADRLPGWALRRLKPDQREAYDRLRWQSPGPAERARLKIVLGWRREREESLALVRELHTAGMVEAAIADAAGVSDRYVRRLLAEPAESGGVNPVSAAAIPHQDTADLALTCESGTGVSRRCSAAPIDGFGTFAELDAWLDRGQAWSQET